MIRNSNFEGLGDQEIEEVDFDGERTYVGLSNGWSLSILNNRKVNPDSLRDVVGLRIANITRCDDDEIEIKFSDGRVIFLGVRDGDFEGPEAMVLYGPEHLIVVWNRA